MCCVGLPELVANYPPFKRSLNVGSHRFGDLLSESVWELCFSCGTSLEMQVQELDFAFHESLFLNSETENSKNAPELSENSENAPLHSQSDSPQIGVIPMLLKDRL